MKFILGLKTLFKRICCQIGGADCSFDYNFVYQKRRKEKA